ncbi:alpha-amylase [Xaviernesmea oryzae]|uniref:Alpha-amylase n=1 Tax=Xaviernesmea oryzae TaxID=464029 RepID=A0A1Q9B176_9HYPH|nr:glycoside hydrolase family 13 protein [Xaviernesmea oryzae]OLP61708.1 alpha-amylase [Xaviernesmea oryzae]SEL01648.1 alpha-glucosidase [Xaviernesmea oryzae]
MLQTSNLTHTTPADRKADGWWRTAVIYQIYPRSFADGNGDGIGDLKGITEKLPQLASLGVDAIWLSPFYPSPQKDAGYDVADYTDVDPLFGTLDDFERMLEQAHQLGLKVIVDIVPNHSSSAHRWFKEALISPEGSIERGRYIFRNGRGPDGALPPNNWQSVFGGPAWTRTTNPDGTPGQWYLHLFDSSQPDFDWSNRWVHDRFIEVLRFWLDRGVDGFRVDVAHGLAKDPELPDYDAGQADPFAVSPYWGLETVHAIFREWRQVLESYGPDRILCAEAWVAPLKRLSDWVRPDEMHQAFNFEFLTSAWSPTALKQVIDDSLAAFYAVGAASTWVLSNHDVIRHASRLGFAPDSKVVHSDGVGPRSPDLPDPVLGLKRARAATALMLALPGCAYLYQGEELGLPEVIDIPDHLRQDPTFIRTKGQRYGRDGCRVPLPWVADQPNFGFGGPAWLPQPPVFGELARDRQERDETSTLAFYKILLAERARLGLGASVLDWVETGSADVLAFTVDGILVVCNFGEQATALPEGELILASGPLSENGLPADTTVWLKRPA